MEDKIDVEGLVKRTVAGETVNGIKVTAYVEDKETPLGDVTAYSGHWSTPGKSARNVRRLFAEEDVMPALTAQQAQNERLRASNARLIEKLLDQDHNNRIESASIVALLEKAEAERDEARAATAAAYERAAQWHDEVAAHAQSGIDYSDAVGIPISNREQLAESVRQHEYSAREIRALATEAEKNALAEIMDAETRACAGVCDKQAETFGTEEYAVGQPLSSFSERFACSQVREAILARLDQNKAEETTP